MIQRLQKYSVLHVGGSGYGGCAFKKAYLYMLAVQSFWMKSLCKIFNTFIMKSYVATNK